MHEEYTLKGLVALLLALITAPTAFVAITVWLLISNTVLELWARLSTFNETDVSVKWDIVSDTLYKFVKYIGVLFFVLTSATAASKYGSVLAWIEFSAYSGIGLWLFTMIGRNASKLMGTYEFGRIIQDIINRHKATK
jgi:hypothetical protein